jgi:hypothetical protein
MTRTTVKQALVTTAILGLATILPAGQAVAGGNVCFDVLANQNVTVTSPSTTTGTITQGGILNGTTTDEFTSALTATPDPNTFSFTDQLTITTKLGTLTDSDVTIFNTAQGLFSTISPISHGTGIFKQATGTLFISGSSTDGVHFTDKIVGQICFP